MAQSVLGSVRVKMLAFLALLAGLVEAANAKATAFRRNTQAALETRAIGIVFLVVGVVVTVIVLAALSGTYFGALGDLIDNFTTVDLGTSEAATVAETILQALIILVAISGAFVLVSLALKAFRGGQ